MVSKVKILLIGIDFASLFSFPSGFPSINIYTYILEQRSKGPPPPPRVHDAANKLITYLLYISYQVHCN